MSGQRENWSIVLEGSANLDAVSTAEAVGVFLWALACAQTNLVVNKARFTSTNYPSMGEIDGLSPTDLDRWSAVFAAIPAVSLSVKATG